MSNMSYCRFENTAKDLEECKEAKLSDRVKGEGEGEGAAVKGQVE